LEKAEALINAFAMAQPSRTLIRKPDMRTLRTAFLTTLLAAGAIQAADTSAGSKPYKGRVHTIPGLIEAEHYDEGRPGAAYQDADEQNRGANYREKTQVDIEKRADASNGHGIGWTTKGEWLVYTVNVKSKGVYDIVIPVASNKKGGDFHIELAGKDVTGRISVPDTGGWQTLKTITHKNVRIDKAGQLKMKVVMDEIGPSNSIADIDYFKFVKTAIRPKD